MKLLSLIKCLAKTIYGYDYWSKQKQKRKILMNKPVYLGLPIIELINILMYEFWYDNVKPKYGEKVMLCFMDTKIFVVNIKTDDIYKDIVENIETWFDASNWELDRPLPKAKNWININ